MDFPGDSTAAQILTWVGIVFAAGFIGYFGRYLSMLIIDRMQKKKARSADEALATRSAEAVQLEIEAQRAKTEKKKTKTEAKRAKKEPKD